MTNTDTTTDTTDTTAEVVADLPRLTSQQEIEALRSVHEFLSAFDRVPGYLTSKWSQNLDTIAVVANSLIGKTKTTEETAEETVVDMNTTAS